jgi:hypothetical protein
LAGVNHLSRSMMASGGVNAKRPMAMATAMDSMPISTMRVAPPP